ncbi:unnamed protein product [Paramecium sonneborni]|uniref:Transmembrane protein n=1 Tax=Paramecium sonneborni TaxID=65129 RepID=A0A8S1PCQ0_9CILI|nr:unnamed protein product [Paramecium sonneborni]
MNILSEEYNENKRITVAKFTKIFSKAINQYTLIIIFLIILIYLSLQNCVQNDLHFLVFLVIQKQFLAQFRLDNNFISPKRIKFNIQVPINKITVDSMAQEGIKEWKFLFLILLQNLEGRIFVKRQICCNYIFDHKIVNQSTFYKFNNTVLCIIQSQIQ